MRKILYIALLNIININAFANPESTQTNTIDSAPKKDSEFKNIINDIKISGFGFARYFYVGGEGGYGLSQQYRIKLDVTTGKVKGFSVTGGIFFSQGSSTPDSGARTHSAVQGSRGTAYNDNFSDRFNIGQIYGSKEFKTNSISINIDGGKMNLDTPFNDKALDLGTGGRINMKQKVNRGEVGYHLSFFDSWMSDHAAYNMRRLVDGDTGQMNAGSLGIGNNLTTFGLKGKLLDDTLHFRLYAANMFRLFDLMTFGDIDYGLKLGNHKLTILAQVAFAMMTTDRAYLLLDNDNRFMSQEFGNTAKTRGIYNIQLTYKIHNFSAKIGYLGSFGSGYGVLLDYKGGIDTAGKVWNGNFTATYEGLGAFGSGSFRGTNINVAYLQLGYKFKFPLKLGLDVAYIFGNTNMPVLNVMANPTIPTHTYASRGSQTFMHADFFEITPSITYNFTKNFEVSIFGAGFIGDIQFFKTRAELKYTF